MISPLDSGLSALSAFSAKMSATADNVANVNTDGFKKNRTIFAEGPFGGTEADIEPVDTPGNSEQVTANGNISGVEASNVDLTEELTGSISTRTGYEANLKTVQTCDEMLGTLLNTTG
jgi:flagellar hook protein FlgE